MALRRELPLAIELAAARTNALDLGTLEAQLDDRFRLLPSGGERRRYGSGPFV